MRLTNGINFANSPVLLGGGDFLHVEAALSDLFFNYQHDNYDAMRKGAIPAPIDGGTMAGAEAIVTTRLLSDGVQVVAAEYEGLMRDATDFAGTLATLLSGVEVIPEALVEDFFHRL